MPAKEMTFDELATAYCREPAAEAFELETALLRSKASYVPIGWFLLECQLLDSSYMGSQMLVPYGPNNTCKEVPAGPMSPRGLASDMSIAIGYLLAENLNPSPRTRAQLEELFEARKAKLREMRMAAKNHRSKARRADIAKEAEELEKKLFEAEGVLAARNTPAVQEQLFRNIFAGKQ